MRLPEWIRKEIYSDGRASAFFTHSTKALLRRHRVFSVCEEARCPNSRACFAKPVAAFMILGKVCVRSCAFCAVETGSPSELDPSEPERIACAVKDMGLRHIVITSVTRDDLPDGGASQFAETIAAVRKKSPHASIEVLTPDFSGDIDALKIVLEACPDVFNHNLETVKRLYPSIRPQAVYERSLQILKWAREINPDMAIKSGFMLGLGETLEEAHELLFDIRKTGCDILTIGQYLRPTKKNHPVVEYIKPTVFEYFETIAKNAGFKFVASSPLVRSSMNADEIFQAMDAER